MRLLKDERIYLLKRRHPIILLLVIFPLILVSFLSLILIFFLLSQKITLPQFLIEHLPPVLELKANFVLAFLLSLFLPLFWISISWIVVQYYLTYWIITNKRIISAKLIGLFNVGYETIPLLQIQDLTVSIKGVLASFFHFGDLKIHTAAKVGEFSLDRIPDPEIAKQVIFEAKIDLQKIQNYDKRSY